MSQLELQDVQVKYGDFIAVDGASLSLETGEIGCLLGPSGCGKTSLLRAIAGFESITRGTVQLNGETISSPGFTLPPERRKVGMVFQDFALFPHLRVDRNVGFGLKGQTSTDVQRRVSEMLELVELEAHAKSYPHELSGGQQQRVALARAMANRPEVLLLDEPFSSLDSELREQLAGEVRDILKQGNITAVLVTHDQHEAFALADTIALLESGHIAQTGTAYDLYHHPANEFVATFLGHGALIDLEVNSDATLPFGLGKLDDHHHALVSAGSIRLLLRPDDVQYMPDSNIHLTVCGRSFRGAHYLYELQLPDKQQLSCLAPAHVDVPTGATLPVEFKLENIIAYEQNSQSSK